MLDCEHPCGVMNAVLKGGVSLVVSSQQCYSYRCALVVRNVLSGWIVVIVVGYTPTPCKCETRWIEIVRKYSEKAMTKLMYLCLHEEGTEANSATL